MPRIAMDTRAQNSWKELIEKEAATRIQCKLRQEEEKNEDEWFVRSKYTQNKPIKTNKMPSIEFPPKPQKTKPVDMMNKINEQLMSQNANLLSDMKPVNKQTFDLLYEGFSKEGKGRSQYLKIRKGENPEDKYEYPILSSYEYGWKLKEVAPAYKTPINGRTKIVEDSFYRRNGVFS
jgi:hypothetical protein